MASYCDKQRAAVQEYLDAILPEGNTYLREAAIKIALENMVSANTDEIVANKVIDYINEYFSDNGNIVYSESFRLMPKAVLYVARAEIVSILRKYRENPNEPLGVVLSCGNSIEMPYTDVPDEPVTIMATLTGGDSPYGFFTEKNIECSTAKEIVKLSENTFQLTFDEPGTYAITAVSSGVGRNIEKMTTALMVKPSKNNPPAAPIISIPTNPIQLNYVSNPNEPVDIVISISGGADPEGRPVTKSLSCATASKVTKVSEDVYKFTFNTTGSHTIVGTSTDHTGKSTTATKALTVNPSTNNPPSDVNISLSCGTGPATLGSNPLKVTATVSGGVDPEGKTVTKTVTCATAKSVVKKTANTFEITFDKVGTHTVTAKAEDPTGLSSKTASVMLTVNPEKNDPPTAMTLSLSASTITLGTGAAAEQTVTVNISGGVDPEGKAVTKTVECTTAKNVSKVNDNQWKVTFDSVRMHVIIATATDNIGLKSVQTATVDVKGQSQTSAEQVMQFTEAKFDSGWSDLIPGCYVSGVTLSLVISSGHSSSTDYLVILGKKSDGTEVILRDNFSSSNRFKAITEGQEVNNSMYGKGNLSSTTWSWNKDPYTLADGIRQVRFVCETPGHESCAKNAKVTFNMSYTYDPSIV